MCFGSCWKNLFIPLDFNEEGLISAYFCGYSQLLKLKFQRVLQAKLAVIGS